MASNSSYISRHEDVNELFGQLGKKLPRPIPILVIGGAAMMEYRLKDSTKDIDIVCRQEDDKEEILWSARELGYTIA